MKAMLLALAVLAVPPIEASELYCSGTTLAPDRSEVSVSRLVSLDAKSKKISIETSAGMATGKLEPKPRLYFGTLQAATQSYLFNLDRYTGELTLFKQTPDGKFGSLDFKGFCEQRDKKF